jgi:hypothetical protein
MSNKCKICFHPLKQEIEGKLLEGKSINSVGNEYHINISGLWNHWHNHLPTDIAKSKHLKDLNEADQNLLRLKKLIRQTDKLLRELTDDKSPKKDVALALLTIDRATKQVEVMHRITEKVQNQILNINIINLPEWKQLLTRLLKALGPYPEAQAAVLRELTAEERVIDVPALLPPPSNPFDAALQAAKGS